MAFRRWRPDCQPLRASLFERFGRIRSDISPDSPKVRGGPLHRSPLPRDGKRNERGTEFLTASAKDFFHRDSAKIGVIHRNLPEFPQNWTLPRSNLAMLLAISPFVSQPRLRAAYVKEPLRLITARLPKKHLPPPESPDARSLLLANLHISAFQRFRISAFPRKSRYRVTKTRFLFGSRRIFHQLAPQPCQPKVIARQIPTVAGPICLRNIIVVCVCRTRSHFR
jgi:hypothetical protein